MNTQPHEPQFADFGDEAPTVIDGPVRLSWLALTSIITGGMALVGCLIPAVGFVPVVLGVIGLFAISKARGGLTGRGLAMGGVLLGVFSLMISTGIWFGAATYLARMDRTYSNVFDSDPANVRTVLKADLAGSITDAQIKTFQEALDDAHGVFVSMPKGLLDVLMMSSGAQGSDRVKSITPPVAGTILPMPVTMAKGDRVILFVLAPAERLGSKMPAVADVGFFTADESRVVWLVSPSQSTSAGTGTAENSDAKASTTPASENTASPATKSSAENETQPTETPSAESSSADD